MARYAQNTTVDAGRSVSDIERVVDKYGAAAFAYGKEDGRAMVGFQVNNRQIRFVLPLPDKEDAEFTRTPSQGKLRTATAAREAYEQAVRQRFRALLLIVKAKFEAVESEVVSFEQEFAAHMVLPDGKTVSEHLIPAIDQAYATGKVPALLGLPAGKGERPEND